MNNKQFNVIIKRTYTTRLLIEAPNIKHIENIIQHSDSADVNILDNYCEALACQELEQMDVDINDWDIQEVEKEKPHLIID